MEQLINALKKIYKENINYIDDEYKLVINNNELIINPKTFKWNIKNINHNHKSILDLTKEENQSVVMLMIDLLNKGISLNDIELEKTWHLGHKNKGRLDVAIKKDGKYVYFIEVKKSSELVKYLDTNKDDFKQLFSYVFQEKSVKWGSYYTYDFLKSKNIFKSVDFQNNLLSKSESVKELIELWDQKWLNYGFVNKITNKDVDIEGSLIKYKNLLPINEDDVKFIFNQFLTILRVHSVSDKSNAFDKMINLFIAKISDELSEDSNILIKKNTYKGMQFQYIKKTDTNVSFLSRLNDLYKDGMKKYLEKDIIDYSTIELRKLLGNNEEIITMFEDLRLKKDNPFAFIEIFDDETFEQNSLIVKDIVELLQDYQFKYNNKFQYLGDFFEELLNSSWKQEAGQFFTPMPLVEMIIESLPIIEFIQENINENSKNILPKAIDYACGSGHFLVSYMDKVQNIINNKNFDRISNASQKKKINSYKADPLAWAKNHVYGIEKDYRLSKTTKVSTFLNGDGEATILNGNGLAKFDSELFSGTELYSNTKENKVFDYVMANPPYSVQGFMKFLNQENIDKNDFKLFDKFNTKSTEIEVLFIERTAQLLKNNGIASIILPRSILASSKYSDIRNFIIEKFEILVIFESGDITFSGTTTSPVILYLKRKDNPRKKYNTMIISSPKILFEDTKKEKKFLGYEFSANKSKLGIAIENENLKLHYSPEIKKHLLGNKVLNNKYITLRRNDEIFIKYNDEIKIYPRYKKSNFNKAFILSEVAEYITNKESDIEIEKIPYIEISNIDIEKNILKPSIKNPKSGWHICEKGDLLISSLAGKKDKWKYILSDKKYRVTNAIHILRFKDEETRDYVIAYLNKNENNVFYNLQSLVDGFKITYAKINEENLMNKIVFEDKRNQNK